MGNSAAAPAMAVENPITEVDLERHELILHAPSRYEHVPPSLDDCGETFERDWSLGLKRTLKMMTQIGRLGYKEFAGLGHA